MSSSWRLLLSMLLAMALSWQGMASASMIACNGIGDGMGQEQGVARVMSHDHSAHDHSARDHHHEHAGQDHPAHDQAAQAADHAHASGGHFAAADADADGAPQSPDHQSCAACAWCCHAMALELATSSWCDAVAPSSASPWQASALALRVPPVPDKPPRA